MKEFFEKFLAIFSKFLLKLCRTLIYFIIAFLFIGAYCNHLNKNYKEADSKLNVELSNIRNEYHLQEFTLVTSSITDISQLDENHDSIPEFDYISNELSSNNILHKRNYIDLSVIDPNTAQVVVKVSGNSNYQISTDTVLNNRIKAFYFAHNLFIDSARNTFLSNSAYDEITGAISSPEVE